MLLLQTLSISNGLESRQRSTNLSLIHICSWANTQKMVAAKQWSFELFYWDLTVGLFLTALLGAVTLGSMGSEGDVYKRQTAG